MRPLVDRVLEDVADGPPAEGIVQVSRCNGLEPAGGTESLHLCSVRNAGGKVFAVSGSRLARLKFFRLARKVLNSRFAEDEMRGTLQTLSIRPTQCSNRGISYAVRVLIPADETTRH